MISIPDYDEISFEHFEKVQNEPLWRLKDAMLYCVGLEQVAAHPVNEPDVDVYYELREYVLKAIAINTLQIHAGGTFGRQTVKPKEFLAWARETQLPLPFINGTTHSSRTVEMSGHMTNELRLLLDARDRFWKNPKIPPKKTVVVSWVIQEAKVRNFKLAESLASAMDSILRTDEAKKGGNKRIT